MPNYLISRIITPAGSIALVTLDQAKTALGIDTADTSQDAALTQQIDQVSRAIDNYCGRIFVRQTYRDQFRYVYNWLKVGEPLRIQQAPLAVDVDGAPVVTVTEDGTVLDPAAWEADIESGELYRLNGSAGAWCGSVILVDYDGGFDPIPADVQGAALEWLTVRWNSSGRDPMLRRETIPDVIDHVYTDVLTASGSAIPAGVRDWLSPYVRWSA